MTARISSSVLAAAGHRAPVVAAGAFTLTLLAALALYEGYSALQDTDSYYHLALARRIAEAGVPERLDWARMTSLVERFGDPVLGFHLLLVPFATGPDPERGGLLALALLDALALAALGACAAGAIGRNGLLVPFLVFAGSTEAALRLVRLRPELLALPMLLLAAYLAGSGRHRWLAAVSLLFALSSSAVHAYLAIWWLLFVYWGWSRRHWEWALPLYASLGVGLGLLAHPSFPANLDSLAMTMGVGLGGMALPGSGGELRPHSTFIAFFTQLGFWSGLYVTWSARQSSDAGGAGATRLRDALGVLSVVFAALYLASSRFALFAFPFAALWLLWTLRARGEGVGSSALLLGRRVPTVVALSVCGAAAAYPCWLQAGNFAGRTVTREGVAERQRIAAALPAGAKVAASWGDADLMVFYAPHARFLEVLDPLPMRLARPDAYWLKERVWSGAERDVPWAVVSGLDSDFLLASRLAPEQAGLLARLRGDPRWAVLHDGRRLLVRWLPEANRPFRRPWEVAAGTPGAGDGGWLPYPWDTDPRGSAAEGFVDLRRLPDPAPCRVLRTALPTAASGDHWAIAPAGSTTVELAGREVLAVSGPLDALLAAAIRFPLPPRDRAMTLQVRTCAVRPGDPGGFYFFAVPS